MKDNILIIGSGQTGIRLASYIAEVGMYPNYLYFNTNVDDAHIEDTITLNDGVGGSGKNPQYTLDNIIPKFEENIEKQILDEIKQKEIKQVVLFNSLGGGSGSAINYHIIKNVLIPYKKQNDLNILDVVVLPMQFEGNPANSNSIVMLKMYYSLSQHASILPVENELLVDKKATDIFKTINHKLCDYVNTIMNFDSFVGKPKANGLGTLDENEMIRVLNSTSGGFLGYYTATIQFGKLKFNNTLHSFDPFSCKSIVVLFKTTKNKNVSYDVLNVVQETFKDQVKIIAESESMTGRDEIHVVCNGINLPDTFEKKVEQIVSSIDKLKTAKKADKSFNKTKLSLGKKSLLNI